ncbi:MAG TPA: 8-amino-7-oxononanoate synthase [Thermodesulfobacteriota bacterium]|nr:8-amino-7-oxononanoate synthase [Thermodesulfobacteriota bacterium]
MKNLIEKTLLELEAKGLKRSLTIVESATGPRVTIEGKDTLLMCSNDYLSLANHPLVKEAAIKAIEKYGVGSGASRLTSGTMTPHIELEEKIKEFKKTEAALVFNSGYNANTGLIPSLIAKHGYVFSDKLNHASITDGCLLSRATLKRYPHSDARALEKLLREAGNADKLIVTDGVFSMNGDIAPLREITRLADKYNATLLVDDAHGAGVLGKNGRGSLEHLGIKNPFVIQMGTLGKAMGTFGAYVAGSKKLKELLINKMRPFIYTTSLPPAICAAGIAAIDVMRNEPWRRKKVLENAAVVRKALNKEGFDTLKSSTQIIPVVIGDAGKTMAISRKLLAKGLFVQGIRPPSVPENSSRLRLTVTAGHTDADIEFAIKTLKEVLREEGL